MNIAKMLEQSGVHLNAGEPQAAEAILRRILAKKSRHPDALNLAGVAAYQQRRYDEAIGYLGRLLKREPRHLGALLNIGAAYNAQARYEDAERCYLDALARDPSNANALCNLGKNLLDQNKLSDARERLQQAVAADPNYWIAQHNLGTCWQRLGNIDAALAAYRKALELFDNPETASEVVACLRRQGNFDQEYALARRLVEAPAPSDVALAAWETLFDAFDWATIRRVQGNMLRLLLDPTTRPQSRSSGLILLNSIAGLGADEVYACHRAWAESLPAARVPSKTTRSNGNGTVRDRLRIAYLSPDFREHSVGYFIRHVIANHDFDRFHVTCYANNTTRDATSQSIAAHASAFIDVTGLSDEELAARVQTDEIDILIDLAGHTRDSRVAVMKLRAAPIQITYIGYPNTSGLSEIDFRLSDGFADSDGATHYSESLLRLPESFLCFGAFDEVSTTATTPAARKGHVTFGSFNNIRKVNSESVALWCKVLEQVPNSRFVLKSRRATETVTARKLRAAFSAAGVDGERLELRPACETRVEHLASYNDIDIALDTFPYHGTTTTCEALWMGVPVISLTGASHAQRVSYSILNNAGLAQFAVGDADRYVDTAASLSRDVEALTRLRGEVRHRLRQSILCDPARFTRQLESRLLDVAGAETTLAHHG